VLMIGFREPLIGFVPVIALQKIEHDVIRGLLVAIQLLIFGMKESFGLSTPTTGSCANMGAQANTVKVRRLRRSCMRL